MHASYYSNIARCAEQRLDLLWQDICAAKGNNWKPFYERSWRKMTTYLAMNALANKT